jgi:hypothetical protein
MTLNKIKTLVLLAFFSLIVLKSFSQSYKINEVGIPDNQFVYSSSLQEKSNWCWAASIKMLLFYEDISKSQSEIVERSYGMNSYGDLPDWTGSLEVITANLNNWDVDRHGKVYTVKANFHFNAPSESGIIDLLSKKKPILICYKSSPTTNHAVLITSCRYYDTPNGQEISEITVRDPWPSNENINSKGVVKYNYDSFHSLINCYWDVTVEFDGEVYVPSNSIRNSSDPYCKTLQKIISGFEDDFINVKGDRLGDTEHMYYSKIKFSNEKRGIIYAGEFPDYGVNFYRGNNLDSANIAFENLKNKFSCIGDELQEEVMVPVEKTTENYKRRTITIHLDNGLTFLMTWRYSTKDMIRPYSVGITIKTKGRHF